jgi:hypothetical protein
VGRRAALLVVLCALGPASAARAGTWKVGTGASSCDGPCNFHDANSGGAGFGIHEAMTSLEVLPGDTVLVWPGTYPAKVTMKSGVVLVSRSGPEATIILGSAGAEPGIFLVDTDPATAVLGFTLTWDASDDGLGGGVAAYIASGTIRDNVFRASKAGIGAGIYLQSSDILVENNLFLINNASAGGGAVAVSGGDPTIRGNTFSGNYAPLAFEGAALYVTGSDLVFERNIVHGSQGGGAVFCGGGNMPTIECNLFWNNPFGAFAGQCVDSVGTSGNLAQDPLFCNVGAGHFGVCADSPALTGACGTIGYVSPAGNCPPCMPTAVGASLEAASWGRVKSLYRGTGAAPRPASRARK